MPLSTRFVLLLALYSLPAIGLSQDIIPVTVPQYDDRIEVTMRYDRSTRNNKPQLNLSDEYKYTNQRVYITIRNKTQNKIVVYLEYYGEKSCGITTSAGVSDANGIGTLAPGQSKSHDFSVSLGDLGDKPCNPVKQADGTYSYIRSVGYTLKRIWEDTYAADKQKAEKAAAEKAKADKAAADKAAADKQRADKAAADRAAAEKKAAATSGTSSNRSTSNTNQPDADFWGEKKAASQVTGGKALPEITQSNNGKYYQKNANNQYVEIGQDDYYRIKTAKDQQAKADAQQAKMEAGKKAADDFASKIKREQEASEKLTRDIENNFNLQRQGYADAAAREEAKDQLKEVTTLSGGYQSVDQLMADFNQKMAQVNSAVNNLTQKRNQAVNSAVAANFNTPELATYGEGIKVIGNFVNAAKEAKERKKAREELEQQKTLMLNNMIAEEKRLLTGIRIDLFSRFKEGALPLSSTKVSANTIYYFVYAYNPAQLGEKGAQLYLSNVFPISSYSDGTWPFKTSITNEVAKLTPLGEVLHGYYTSQQEAEAMQSAMADVFRQTGGSILPVAFKGKKTSTSAGSSGSGDFWETGKKTATDSTSKEKKPKKDDFWNN